MRAFRIAALALLGTLATATAFAAVPGADPLAAVDLNRNAIIADIVQGFDGDGAALTKRLAALRADRLLSASLASSRESLESILAEAEKSRDAAISRAGAKALGSANSDLVYTPISPCRLIDTRGFGAPIQGGAFTPNERRAYVPAGQCALPITGVASMLISFTTQNLTPTSGGYLAILGPAAPVTTTVDIFNFNSEWSASNTAVITGPAAQFDVFVNTASAHLVVDILGYFAPPTGTVVKSITAGTGLTGGTITDTGTVEIATAYQLPQACTNGQVPQSNGAGGWSCVTPATPGSGTVTSITAGTGLTGGTITNTGTITLATAFQLPQACTNGQVAQSNGAGAWSCVTPPTPSNGTVTGVTASAPLASSGGAAPDISLTAGTAGQVLVSAGGPPTWSDSLSLNGNITLATATSLAGIVQKGASRFIHDFGSQNTFIGLGAGNFSMTGTSNTGGGFQALSSNVGGNFNTAVGANALQSNTAGLRNTATGSGALRDNSTGNFNTAVGDGALALNTTGPGNTAIGSQALGSNTLGGSNTAVGNSALFSNTTGTSNTAVGVSALYTNSTGSSNTGFGQGALSTNSTGTQNAANGTFALQSNTTGSNNTANGANALMQNTLGNNNTATGRNALNLNTTGINNTATGESALAQNTTGHENIAFGGSVLVSNTTGTSNTGNGFQALRFNTTGFNNSAVGFQALRANTTGFNNIAMGFLAGQFITTGSFNIAIGNQGLPTDDHVIRIGDPANPPTTFIAGIRGVATGVADGVPVVIDSLGQLGTISSSRRFKDDVTDMDAASSALMKLRPVTFHYKSDRSATGRTLQYGLIAEEVAEVYPGLVAHSADGQVETVMYQYLPTMLLNEVQKQQRTIEAQARHIEQLQADRRAQMARVDALERHAERMTLALERLVPVNVAQQQQ